MTAAAPHLASRSPFALDVDGSIARIRELDGRVHAFVCTRLEAARAEALRSTSGPLAGTPFSLKDCWDTTVLPTSGGSHRYRERQPATDAAPYRAFRAAGAILMGKTNLSDLSLAPEATSWVGGATKNPYDATRTAGGSSGGAAAAVATGMVGFDWGTDFGGSIRLPAAFCGVLGMRLSAETWPVVGMFPSSPESVRSMNGQGPITRTVAEMRALLAVAAPELRASAPTGFRPRLFALHPPDRGRWPSFGGDVTPHLERVLGEVAPSALPPPNAVRNAAIAMYAAHLDDMAAQDPLGMFAGTRAALAAVLWRGRFGDLRLHPSTAKLLLLMALGHYTLFRSKPRAVAGAERLRAQMEELWQRGAVVVAPVCAYPAPKVGTSTSNPQLISCCVLVNLVDATALAVPFGRFDDGLPRALQLMGPPGSELALLDLAEGLIASRDGDPALRLPPPSP